MKILKWSRLKLKIGTQHFPYFLSDRDLKLKGITLILKGKTDLGLSDVRISFATQTGTFPAAKSFTPYLEDNKLQQADFGKTITPIGKWKIKLSGAGLRTLDVENIEDLILAADYIIT